MKIKKYEHFSKTYKEYVGDDIYNKKDGIIQFINYYSSNQIKPFKIVKLISQECHFNIYKDKYSKLMDFYCNLKDDKINKRYFEEITNYINEMDKQNKLKIDKKKLIEGFKNLNINKNSRKLIMTEYLKTIYDDLNNFIKNSDVKIEDCLYYYTALIMYCFVNYSNVKNIYYKSDQDTIYMGANLSLSELLQYKKAKGLITFGYFSIFYENEEFAKAKVEKGNNLKFSVTYKLNIGKRTINAFDIKKFVSHREKAILVLPYTFWELKSITYDLNKYNAEITLVSA
jgi:hypothetical protein